MEDDLIEYCRFRPEKTGLNVEIFLDDGEAYKRNGHPLWVYMQNNYNDISDVIPIEVETLTVISDKKVNIDINDYENVLKYIKQNKELIKGLTDNSVKHLEYVELHKKID